MNMGSSSPEAAKKWQAGLWSPVQGTWRAADRAPAEVSRLTVLGEEGMGAGDLVGDCHPGRWIGTLLGSEQEGLEADSPIALRLHGPALGQRAQGPWGPELGELSCLPAPRLQVASLPLLPLQEAAASQLPASPPGRHT